MASISTKDLFQKAEELRQDRMDTLAAQKANREILRNLSLSGMLSDAEEEQLEELYPTRTREPGEAGE